MNPPLEREQLLRRRCGPLGPSSACGDAAIQAQLALLPGWTHGDGAITRTFRFRDYHETIAFVNAIAQIAHDEDHHPELNVGFDRCTVGWSTHSAGGVTENDFVCAAKSDAAYGRARP